MPGIFVSYRRNDSAHVAGRLKEALAARFGSSCVFMDVDSVAPGEDFVRRIEETIAGADALLVVIGPNWLTAQTPDGGRKIDQADDFTRLEIANALRNGVRLIPVLVDDAPMPRTTDLPDDVADLVRRNAVHLRHTSFARDVDALLHELGASASSSRPTALSPPLLVGASGALVLVAIGAYAVTNRPTAPAPLATTVALAADPAAADSRRFITSLTYRSERDRRGRLRVVADLPYRERLRADAAISGVRFDDHPFASDLPRLAVQVVNAAETPVTLNEVQFAVASAEPDLAALPVMREKAHDYRFIKTVNEGWGGFENPAIRVTQWGVPAERDGPGWSRRWRGSVILADPCAAPTRATAIEPFTVPGVLDEAGDVTFDLETRVPDAYDGDLFVCAVGELTYADAGVAKALAFRTRVSNHRPLVEVAGIALGAYDVFLDSDRDGYTAVAAVQAEIPPGETGTAEVTVFTDRTSSFVLTQAVRTAAGDVVPGETFELEIFRPRRDPRAYMPTSELDEMTGG